MRSTKIFGAIGAALTLIGLAGCARHFESEGHYFQAYMLLVFVGALITVAMTSQALIRTRTAEDNEIYERGLEAGKQREQRRHEDYGRLSLVHPQRRRTDAHRGPVTHHGRDYATLALLTVGIIAVLGAATWQAHHVPSPPLDSRLFDAMPTITPTPKATPWLKLTDPPALPRPAVVRPPTGGGGVVVPAATPVAPQGAGTVPVAPAAAAPAAVVLPARPDPAVVIAEPAVVLTAAEQIAADAAAAAVTTAANAKAAADLTAANAAAAAKATADKAAADAYAVAHPNG